MGKTPLESSGRGRTELVDRVFRVPVVLAALAVIPVVIVEANSTISSGWKSAAGALNWVIWAIFAAELVAYLAVVKDRRTWLKEHPLEVVIVFLTPPFIPAGLQAVRVFRLLRLVRLFRLAQLGHRLFSLEGLRYASLLAVLTALGGGSAFAAVEGDRYSTWDGVWWAVTTITTIGSNDVYPHTTAGRVIEIVVVLVGIGFVAILTGAVAQRFLAPQIQAAEEHVTEGEAAGVGEILNELRGVMSRLTEIEDDLERLQGETVLSAPPLPIHGSH